MKKLLIFFFLFISLTIQATTYYIRTDGNNTNAGTANTSGGAWRNLSYACSHTASGDLITVEVGTFVENSRCNLPVGVSIIGQGVTSVIQAGYLATSDNDGLIWLNSGSSTDGNQSISYIELDGNSFTGTRAIAVNYRNKVEIHHCTIINFLYSGVWFTGAYWYGVVTASTHCTGNSIHDCIITDCAHRADGSGNYGHIRWDGQDGLLIYNNTLVQPALVVSGLERCGDILASIWSKRVKIYNNILTKPNGVSGKWNFFSELFFTEGDCEIYGNTFNGNATLDIVDVRKQGTSTFGIKIYNNTWTNSAQAPATAESIQAIDFEERGAIQYCYVYNNHFKNTNTAVQFDVVANATGKYDQTNARNDGTTLYMDHCYVYYNLFENVGAIPVSGCAPAKAIAIITEGSLSSNAINYNNIYIDNNTIVSGVTYAGYAGVLIQTTTTMTNLYVRNNIIQGFSSDAIQYYYKLGTPSGSTHYIQDNLLYNNNSGTVGFSGVTISGINYTPSGSPGGVYSTSSPAFVSGTDFHLTGSSPAINHGIYAGYTADYVGAVVNNPPEIGAYEYGSTGTVPMTAFTLSSAGNATTISAYHGTLQFSTSGVTPSNTTDQTFTWSVTNGTGSATISSGLLTAVTNGTVTVRATAHDGSGVYNTKVITLSNQVITGYPVVITTILTDFTTTTATLGGNVTSDGGATVTSRGLCYAASFNPTTGDSVIHVGTGTGSFVSTITGLALGGTYHVRAFATNSVGTSYGADIQITTRAALIVTY